MKKTFCNNILEACEHGAVKSLCPLCAEAVNGFDLLGDIRGQTAVFLLTLGREPNIILMHPSTKKYVPEEYRELEGLEINGLRVVEDISIEPQKILVGFTLKS